MRILTTFLGFSTSLSRCRKKIITEGPSDVWQIAGLQCTNGFGFYEHMNYSALQSKKTKTTIATISMEYVKIRDNVATVDVMQIGLILKNHWCTANRSNNETVLLHVYSVSAGHQIYTQIPLVVLDVGLHKRLQILLRRPMAHLKPCVFSGKVVPFIVRIQYVQNLQVSDTIRLSGFCRQRFLPHQTWGSHPRFLTKSPKNRCLL